MSNDPKKAPEKPPEKEPEEFLSDQTKAEMKAGKEALVKFGKELSERQAAAAAREPHLPPDPDQKKK